MANGERAEWGLDVQLLAMIADTVRMANWQRGGGKGHRPKPLPRPGQEDNNVRQIKARRVAARSGAELRARLEAKWIPEEVTTDGG